MPSSARAWIVVALIAGASAMVRAQAAELPLTLEWSAPAECPQAGDVRAELARIARPLPGHALAPLVAQGAVDKLAGRYAVRLQTEQSGVSGERVLEATECSSLVQSVTLVLALAFGPGVELAASAESAPNGAPEQTTTADREPPPEPSSASPAHAERVRAALFLGAGGDLALFSGPALGLIAGAQLELAPRLAIDAQASAWLGAEHELAADARARFDGLSARLLGCYALVASAPRVQACAGLRISAVRGRARGAPETETAVAPWYALGGGATFAIPVHGPLHARFDALLFAALVRPRFAIDGLAETYQLATLVPELALGLELEL